MAYRRQATTSTSNTALRSSSRCERHPKYYIESADLHLIAGNVLFRVHGYFFSRESPIFHRRMNPSSPGETKEGSSEEDPVWVDETPEDFEQLLWVFYNPRYSIYEGTLSQWNIILRLADKYNFNEIKDLAVREMHKKPELNVIEKMGLYHKYRVPERYLVPLYAELCQRDEPLTVEEGEGLGAKASVLIGGMRERLRVQIWEKKYELLRAQVVPEEKEKADDEDEETKSSALRKKKNALEGMTKEEVISAFEEHLGVQAGTSIILEEGEHQSQESSIPSTPSSRSRRNSRGQTVRSPLKMKRSADLHGGYVLID